MEDPQGMGQRRHRGEGQYHQVQAGHGTRQRLRWLRCSSPTARGKNTLRSYEELRRKKEEKKEEYYDYIYVHTFYIILHIFSVMILSNDTVRTLPHTLAYANAIHYAIALLALTSLGIDKISLFDYDLGGELL